MSNMAHHPALLSRLRVTVAGQTREFADAVVPLGRDTALPVVVVHPDVSRRHAEFRRGGGGWFLVDLQSTNGTFLGGRRVSHERLPEGQPVQVLLGGTDAAHVLVEVLPAPAAPPPQAPPQGFQDPQHPPYQQAPPQQLGQGQPYQPPAGPTPAYGTPAYGPPGHGDPQPGPPPYVEPATVAAYAGAAGRHRQHARAAAAAGSPRARPHGDPVQQPDGPEPLDRPVADLRHRPRRPAGLAAARDAEHRCGAVPPRPRQLQRHLRQRPPAQWRHPAEPGGRGHLRQPDLHLDRHQPGLARHPGRPDPVRGEPHHDHQGRQATARGDDLRARPVQPDRGDRAVGRGQVHAARRAHRVSARRRTAPWCGRARTSTRTTSSSGSRSAWCRSRTSSTRSSASGRA